MGRGAEHVEWIRRLLEGERERRKLSHEWVARAVTRVNQERDGPEGEKVSKQTAFNWATGSTTPRIDQYESWAEALGMRFETALVPGDDDTVAARVPVDLATTARLMRTLTAEDRELVARFVERISRE